MVISSHLDHIFYLRGNRNKGIDLKILFTSPIIEHPAAGGPQLRIENSIKALAKVSDLHVVSRNSKNDLGGDTAVQFYSSIVKIFLFAPSVKGLSKNRYIRKMQKIIRNIFVLELENDTKYILEYVTQHNIDVLWFGFGNISYDLIKLVKEFNPSLKVVCDTDSVWSRFILRELPYENNPERIEKIKAAGAAKELEESEWVNICDVTTAVSEIDARYYRNLAIDKDKIMLFSNVIDVKSYEKVPKKPKDFISPNIYLAGSFWLHSPMEKAARWFIDEIYPLVKKEIPNIHFYIIGRGSVEILADISDESISVLGKVSSVLPYLCHANVSLVPLQFESGTRFKIMEAAACKIPIVSTVLGAEGIPVTDKKDILLAGNAKSFAEAIVKLIENESLSKKIADNCYDLIVKDNSVESLAEEAKQIIGKLVDD